jgi:hypothetical protein
MDCFVSPAEGDNPRSGLSLADGHLLEFPQIRVDCFTTPTPSRPHLIPSDPSSSSAPWVKAPNARIYLLTHVHTDHLVGLSNAFTGKIICSPDTKRMLLRLEPEIERERLDGGVREQKVLKYDGLRKRMIGEGKTQRVIDIIVRVLESRSLACAKLILAGDCAVW